MYHELISDIPLQLPDLLFILPYLVLILPHARLNQSQTFTELPTTLLLLAQRTLQFLDLEQTLPNDCKIGVERLRDTSGTSVLMVKVTTSLSWIDAASSMSVWVDINFIN